MGVVDVVKCEQKINVVVTNATCPRNPSRLRALVFTPVVSFSSRLTGHCGPFLRFPDLPIFMEISPVDSHEDLVARVFLAPSHMHGVSDIFGSDSFYATVKKIVVNFALVTDK
ncbi:hypothetical protein TNCV_2866831 [Trichonephila clavipes]|nr:hypothetical protein TNCV_2866831 [Trichonephila clavipes]